MIKFKRSLVFIMSICLVPLFSGCYLFPEEEPLLAPPLMEPVQVSHNTVKAERGDIELRVQGQATLVPVEHQYMFFTHSGGRIKSINVSVGDDVEKGDLLVELYTDNIENQIKMQQFTLNKARISYNKLKDSDASKYDLEMAAIDIEMAKLRLNELVNERELARLTSKISGTVVYRDTDLAPGDSVAAYHNIIGVADPDKLHLRYNGSEATRFTVGSEVEIYKDDQTFIGQVVSTPHSVPSDADESLQDAVIIESEELPESFEMGELVRVSQVLEKSENTIVLPLQAIRTYLGRKYVHVLEDGLSKERDVELGVETTTQVEIISGIEEGEEIILK